MKAIVPADPNLDKLAALCLFDVYSTSERGLHKNYDLGYFTTGHLPEGMTYRDCPDTAFIDCAKSQFDGHGENRGKSGCELIAEYLGCENNPETQLLIQRITEQDRDGISHNRELGNMVRNAYRVGKKFSEIRKWVFVALKAIMEWEKSHADRFENPKKKHPWKSLRVESIGKMMKTMDMEEKKIQRWVDFCDCVQEGVDKLLAEAEEIVTKIRPITIYTYRGPKDLMVIRGDNPFVSGKALKVCDVLVFRHSRLDVTMIAASQVQQRQPQLYLQSVAKAIRIAEANKVGIRLEGDLEMEGFHPQVKQWYLHEKCGTRLYNGTEQHTDVVPTNLTGQEIVNAVTEGLKPRRARV